MMGAQLPFRFFLYVSTLKFRFHTHFFFFLQHTRFVQECKDAEPDVLFIGDSMVQLMQQFDVSGHKFLCLEVNQLIILKINRPFFH